MKSLVPNKRSHPMKPVKTRHDFMERANTNSVFGIDFFAVISIKIIKFFKNRYV